MVTHLQAWVSKGWLEGHIPEGARKEEFELSAAAATLRIQAPSSVTSFLCMCRHDSVIAPR